MFKSWSTTRSNQSGDHAIGVEVGDLKTLDFNCKKTLSEENTFQNMIAYDEV